MLLHKSYKHLILLAILTLLSLVGWSVSAAAQEPGAPDNLEVSYNDNGHLVLSWDAPTDVGAQANWYDGDWEYRKVITIDSTQVAGSGNHINIPILISVTDVALSNARSDGLDILFTDEDGNKLDHDKEFFNKTTGEMQYWVKIPSLSSGSDTEIYMYYGNPTATNQQNQTGTWSNGYVGVWHLQQNPGSVEANGIKDRSSQKNHGTDNGSMDAADAITGQIDGAIDFDGVNDYINIPRDSGFEPSNALTVEAWLNWDDETASTNGKFINKAKDDSAIPYNSYSLEQYLTNDEVHAQINVGGTAYTTAAATISTDTWHHVAFTWANGSPLSLFVDGALDNATGSASGTITYYPTPLRLGHSGRGEANTFVDASLDEVRISNKVRTPAWLETQYNNVSDPGAFLDFSVHENYAGDITDYVVQYKLSGDSSYVTYSDGISISTEAAIPGLLTGVGYDFRVAAVNDQGQGDFSDVFSINIARDLVANEVSNILFLCDPAPEGTLTTSCEFTLTSGLKLPNDFKLAVGTTTPSGSCNITAGEVTCADVPIQLETQGNLKLYVSIDDQLIDSGESVNIYDPSEDLVEVYDDATVNEILIMIDNSSVECKDYQGTVSTQIDCAIILSDTNVPGYDIKTALVNNLQTYSEKCEFLGLQYICSFEVEVDADTNYEFMLMNGAERHGLDTDIFVDVEDQVTIDVSNPVDTPVSGEEPTNPASNNSVSLSVLVGLLSLSLVCLFLVITLTYDGFWDKTLKMLMGK